METSKRVIKNTGILYAKMGITVFISLYTTKVLLNSLGAVDFGIFNVVGGAIIMLTFLNTAMAAATQRFMSYAEGEGNKDKQKRIFTVSIALHIIIAILLFAFLQIVGYYLFEYVFNMPSQRVDSAKWVYQFMVISTLFSVISVPYDAVMNAHENMMLYSILGVIESFAKLGIAIYISITSFDKLVVYGLLIACLTIILLIARRVYCHRNYQECEINFKLYFDKSIFRELTSFAGWSFLGSSTSIVSFYGQGVVMNTFFGTVVNAAHGIAAQVSGQLSAFAVTMQKALNPTIAKSAGAGNESLMLRASMIGSKVSFFLLMFFFIPVLVEMPYIFNIWLKSVPEYAVIFCRLLLIRNLIEQLFVTLGASIVAKGNIRSYQIFSSALGVFPLIVTFLLFKIGYPPYYLYIVFICYSVLRSFQILYYAKKNCNLPILFFSKTVMIRCIVSFIIVISLSFIPVMLIKEPSLIRLALVGITSSCSFIIAVWLTGFTRDEKTQVSHMLNHLFKKFFKRKY